MKLDLAGARDQLAAETEAGRRLTKQMDSLGKDIEELHKRNRDLETEVRIFEIDYRL